MLTSDKTNSLIEILRAELQEYGALSQLLEDHQKAIMNRETERILSINNLIDEQVEVSQEARLKRESFVSELATSLGYSKDTSVKKLLPSFEDNVQELLLAIVDEIFKMIGKTQYKARQNQVLIKSASQVAENLINTIIPKQVTNTYSRKGSVKMETSTPLNYFQTSV